MDDVKWIKLKVGMFDGISFKKIKRAKIDGIVDFRDKLTAVWFELLDLGAKVNNEGLLLNDEIAFRNYEDIAIMLDRTNDEIKLCLEFFVKENMIVIIDDVYAINNWTKYQNNDGLNKIREQNRIRQKNYRNRQKEALMLENNNNVSVTLHNANALIDNNTSTSNSYSNSLKEDIKDSVKEKKETKRFVKPNVEEIKKYIKQQDYNLDANYFYDYQEARDWILSNGKKMKDWKAVIRTWSRNNFNNTNKKGIGGKTVFGNSNKEMTEDEKWLKENYKEW